MGGEQSVLGAWGKGGAVSSSGQKSPHWEGDISERFDREDKDAIIILIAIITFNPFYD